MTKKDEELLGKRKFDGNCCEDKCPFFYNHKDGYCDFYDFTLSFDYRNDKNNRCKKCTSDIIPDSNTEILQLLRRICKKMGA